MWPWSYDNCKKKYRYSQEISACSKVSHYGMDALKGRGSPEIDILEAMGGAVGPLPNTGMERPYFSASLQVAPGIEDNRPIVGHQPEKVIKNSISHRIFLFCVILILEYT